MFPRSIAQEDEVDALVDEVGKNIGPATVFVSHPWNMKFKELIFMLERLEKQLVEKARAPPRRTLRPPPRAR